MADSITLKSSAYDGRYLQVDCTQISKDSAKNESTVKWKLSSIGGAVNDGYPVCYSTGPTALVIGGNTVYSQGRVSWESGKFPANLGSVEGTVTVQHDNDGTKEITVSLSTAIYTSTVSTYSDKWTLDSIQRYANFTSLYLSDITENSVAVNWDADATVGYIAYYLNGGGAVHITPSKPFYIHGLSENTENTLQVAIRRADSPLWTYSGTMKFTTYDYPKPTSMNHFIIGEGAEINVYNPLKRTYTLNLVSRENWGYIGTYTGNYEGVVNAEFKTEEAIQWQYASIPNKQSGGYIAEVTYDGVKKTLDWGGTYSVDSSKCSPTFTDFDYADISDNILKLTGNSQVFVKNQSTLMVSISESQKMIAKNGATPDKYVISIDTKSETLEYAETAVSKEMGIISNKKNVRLTVTAFDSRGLSTPVHKEITVYDYELPIINVDVKRLNNFEAQTTLKVNGTFSPIMSANGLNANTVRNVCYRYREQGGTWSEEIELTKVITDKKYTCNDVVLSLDNSKAFEFEVSTKDSVSYNTVPATVDVGKAVFFVSSNKKSCYINGQEILMYDVVDEW